MSNIKLPEDDLSKQEKQARVMIRCILTDGKRVFAGSREKNTRGGWSWNRYSNITHWRPLPPPPTAHDAEKGKDNG